MPLETRLFDPAAYLDSYEARAAYVTEAIETNDPAFIADALGVIARARGLNRVAQDAGLSDETLHQTLSAEGNSEMDRTLRIIHALGLRLTAEPIQR